MSQPQEGPQLDANEVVQQTLQTAMNIVAQLVAENGMLKAQIAQIQKQQSHADPAV